MHGPIKLALIQLCTEPVVGQIGQFEHTKMEHQWQSQKYLGPFRADPFGVTE
jgi:hypothetical protein